MSYVIQPNSTIEGYLYCIINDSYAGWVKVGQTSNLIDRLHQYNTCSPENNFYYLVNDKVPSYKIGEKYLIETFNTHYPTSSKKGLGSEWFKAEPITAKKHFLDVIYGIEEYVRSYHIVQKQKIKKRKEKARRKQLEKEKELQKEKEYLINFDKKYLINFDKRWNQQENKFILSKRQYN